MTQPSAKIIADSISEQGHRLTTMEVVMHRFVLAEMNTHRAFSRNSASSRAIPFYKTQDRVFSDPAYPVYWGKEQKGMQSGEEFTDSEIHQVLKGDWDGARHYSSHYAGLLHKSGLHKSLVNRLLEPFMWHTAIITATDWDNFFHQRCSPQAQPEMKAVADEMQRAYYMSNPRVTKHGDWHTPYVGLEDAEDIGRYCYAHGDIGQVRSIIKKVSVARCARVSYLTHDGIRDFTKDVELFDKLKGSGHWSPFEHVATPVVPKLYGHERQGTVEVFPNTGNFHGWNQLRKEFTDENVGRGEFVPNLPDVIEYLEGQKNGESR